MFLSRCRLAVVTLAVLGVPAWAVDISGTINATFQGFDMYGSPTVKLDLNLACTLTCPASAPQLHFGVSGGVGGKFAGEPTTTAGYTSAFFGTDPSGQNSTTTTSFPVGSAFYVLAKSATCWCGNANGQGGYIDLQTSTVTIPPRLLLNETVRVGDAVYAAVFARPMGSDTVDVRLQGGGLDEVRTFVAADFGGSTSSGSKQVIFTPTQPGTVSMTATLQPYGTASAVGQIVVTERNAGSSGGGGGSSSGTGGGTGGGDAPAGGCSSAPGLVVALGALLLARRQRRTPATPRR